MPDISHIASSIFSPTGALAALTGYEYRPQQETMARAIADTLHNQRHLIIEAPTGVGKTLAYLVPSILYALQEGRKAIVSTHTKNLQEQIFKKDIPLVHAVLGKDFRVALLKGRRNYLCTTRLRNTFASTGNLFEKDELDQLNGYVTGPLGPPMATWKTWALSLPAGYGILSVQRKGCAAHLFAGWIAFSSRPRRMSVPPTSSS